jgi:hypothetical protein
VEKEPEGHCTIGDVIEITWFIGENEPIVGCEESWD